MKQQHASEQAQAGRHVHDKLISPDARPGYNGAARNLLQSCIYTESSLLFQATNKREHKATLNTLIDNYFFLSATSTR